MIIRLFLFQSSLTVLVQQGSEQLVLWDDIRTASHNHMQRAFQQRRQQILGDC